MKFPFKTDKNVYLFTMNNGVFFTPKFGKTFSIHKHLPLCENITLHRVAYISNNNFIRICYSIVIQQFF